MNEHMDLHEEYKHISDEMAANGKSEALEARLRRLESAIAAIADTNLMEERLMQRVMMRMDQPQPSGQVAPGTPIPAGMMIEAGKALLPGAMQAISNELKTATNPQTAQPSSFLAPQAWLLTDMIFDIRTFLGMYFDYRYHPGWTAKVIPPLGLILLIVTYFVFTTIPMVLVDLLIIMIVYKSLLREGARYRAMLPYLPPKVKT
jgi:hypothetical protein